MPVKPLLIIQMGVPPQDIIEQFGEQSRWMLDAMDRGAGADAADDGANSNTPDPMASLPATLASPVARSEAAMTIVRPSLGEALPPPQEVAGAIITGSWHMVTDREDWSELTAAWIREAHACRTPMLGICYGHQLMAHALGGEVDFHPQGRELGCYPLHLLGDISEDSVLGHLPATFDALLSHEQTVVRPPQGATVLARSAHDPHQILRYGQHALSVQFHPEFSVELMRACINRRTDELTREGLDAGAMLRAVQATPDAGQILLRFAQLARLESPSRNAPAYQGIVHADEDVLSVGTFAPLAAPI